MKRRLRGANRDPQPPGNPATSLPDMEGFWYSATL